MTRLKAMPVTPTTITRDAWLSALHASGPTCEPDALTVRELAAMMGVAKTTARSMGEALVRDGLARVTHKRVYRQIVMAYVLLGAA